MMKIKKEQPVGRRFRALITQQGKTRTVYTRAETAMDALCNLSDDSSLLDAPLTIVLRPLTETEA
jgi:hypothetical protein